MANVSGLPPDAVSLAYLVQRGCMPYALDRKNEEEAMRGVGLQHHRPFLGLEPGDTAPFWSASYPGRPRVNVGQGVCNTVIHGSNFGAYQAAAEIGLRGGFGAAPGDDGRSKYRAWLPGQVTGCRNGVRYTYYRTPGRPIFEVDLTRIGDCADDRLREAR